MQPDIEIYLLSCPTPNIEAWLTDLFGPLDAVPSTETGIKFIAHYQGQHIPITILEQAAGKRFTSVWFDSEHTPWANDIECAEAAFASLGCEVRCNMASWEEDEELDPDLWWRINKNGAGPYIWR
ncbi:hypothetical protein FJM67_07440 [Maribrevibacterium harenarium]|uniref:Uncharacterized protein n=1 Tax=Maribrevibacterium harenarium TaxID=2589817 RepID=A0A501WWM9_9GAMM|nr:hypothetical protein [Maribrevibacterium harenarium]TPE52840.1 hypothetical protein FJM67_07440 [Maribrevibacterium harenarium]